MAQHLRVLIIEDSDDDALILVHELKRSGYEPVYERVDTAEAMKSALQTKPWDIVISDYVMPRFSGLFALKLLQQSQLDIPFIILSGHIGEETAIEAMKAGAHDYILKDRINRLAPVIQRELQEAKNRKLHKLAELAKRVNEQKRIEAEIALRKLNQELEQRVAERTAELEEALKFRDEFISIASHELKTPLTALMLQLQVSHKFINKYLESEDGLKDRLKHDPSSLLKILDQSSEQTRKLSILVDNLLDMTRIRAGKLTLDKQSIDLCKHAQDAIQRTQMDSSSHGIQISFSAPRSIIGHWDPTRIDQVFCNLLSNAIRYGNSKPINVALRSDEKSGLATIQVHDDGMGIPPDQQKKIFERFERVNSHHKTGGLGLGLYIVRQIIECHGGSILVESEPGHGSTFIVNLPTLDSDPSGPQS